ncbi:MAG TPA: MoxR family ATPase [Nitrososphaerales archaeon]|nr:MoxR family ATPase [Nitrososphaerales archaeon]
MSEVEASRRIAKSVEDVVIGKKDVVEKLLLSLVAGGHVLLEGSPGTGKTTMAKTFSYAIGGSFKRIQLTPDLLPADLVGSSVFNPKEDIFVIREGPIFANIVMLDELNRATPRTQAALIEAMQEGQVTIEGNTMPLPRPYLVIATQLPPGASGTYPLTEVQVDRFAMRIPVGHPTPDEEKAILTNIDSLDAIDVQPAVKQDQLNKLIGATHSVTVSERVKDYVVSISAGLRSNTKVRIGPSTRASIWLYKLGRARALLEGRKFVIPDDVKFVAREVLTHRVILTPQAEGDGVEPEQVVTEALNSVPVPKE